MRLFHQLAEEDQHNAIHYCMHVVIEDMLDDGVQLEPFSDEDRKMRDLLVKVVDEATKLPKEEQFDFIVNHKEGGPVIFDISLDMARSAYYHPDEDLVIHYESLRAKSEEQTKPEELIETVEELMGQPKKGNHSLN